MGQLSKTRTNGEERREETSQGPRAKGMEYGNVED
jgi:hypothetical protein